MNLPDVFLRRQATNATLSIPLNVLIEEPAEEYHAKRGQFLSSHALAEFRRCPLLYSKRQQGVIPDKDRPAYALGRAAHALILEGQAVYEAGYAIGGPVNPKTGKPYGANTKAFQEWAAGSDKEVLSAEQDELIQAMAASVNDHDVAQGLLAEGQAEGVIRTIYCDTPCQIRIDWLNPTAGIVDLKTCDELDWFEADARRYGYAHQLAFYRSVLDMATGITAPVHILAVEKREPFRCGVWRITDAVLDAAEKDNAKAIERLRRYRAEDAWPTGYEDLRTFDYIS